MKSKWPKRLIFVMIPLATVYLCRALRVAQGERTEEIAFGAMLGMFLDLLFFLAAKLLLFIRRKP